jgi:hypothetical protein
MQAAFRNLSEPAPGLRQLETRSHYIVLGRKLLWGCE